MFSLQWLLPSTYLDYIMLWKPQVMFVFMILLILMANFKFTNLVSAYSSMCCQIKRSIMVIHVLSSVPSPSPEL